MEAAKRGLRSRVNLLSNVSIALVLAIMGLHHFHILPIRWLEGALGAEPRWTDTIILVLLIVVVEHVVNIMQELRKSPSIQTFPESQLAYAALASALEDRPAHSVDMIQFTGYAAIHFLARIAENSRGTKVRILLQHPEVAATFDKNAGVDHTANIRTTINHVTIGLQEKLNVQIAYYRTPASVAAIIVDDDILAVSWYRYYRGNTPSAVLLRGHNVATVLVRGSEGRHLRQMAKGHFDTVWKDAELETGVA